MIGRPAFSRCTQGSVGIVAALIMPILIGFTALGTDYGYFLLDKQHLQDSADLAALSAAASGGRETETARRILAENGQASAQLDVLLGSVEPMPDGRPAFVPGKSGGAVLVRAKRPTELFFSRLFLDEAPTLDVTAVALVKPVVSMAIGTKLATVSGGIPAALTQALLGSRVDLSVLGHDGLVRSTIQTSGLLAALADTLGVASGTLGDLLDKEIPVRVLVQVVAQTLRNESQSGPAAEAAHLAFDLAKADATIKLGELLALPRDVRALKVGTPASYLSADLSVSSLLTAALTPRRAGSALSTALSVPGLVSTELELLVGEPMVASPPLAVAEPDGVLETAQIRSRVALQSGVLLGALATRLNVPLEFVVAAGEARIVAASCHADPAKRSVTVEVLPGAARLEIGEGPKKLETAGLAPSGRSVEILGLPALKVRAHALATLRSASPTTVTFSGREIGNGTIRTVGSTKMVSALVADLFRTLTLEVRVLGLGLGIGDGLVTGLVKTALLALAEPIDSVLDGLLASLGVRLGAIDVRVDDIVCDQPKIVV